MNTGFPFSDVQMYPQIYPQIATVTPIKAVARISSGLDLAIEPKLEVLPTETDPWANVLYEILKVPFLALLAVSIPVSIPLPFFLILVASIHTTFLRCEAVRNPVNFSGAGR